jgi:hypothetical protein
MVVIDYFEVKLQLLQSAAVAEGNTVVVTTARVVIGLVMSPVLLR